MVAFYCFKWKFRSKGLTTSRKFLISSGGKILAELQSWPSNFFFPEESLVYLSHSLLRLFGMTLEYHRYCTYVIVFVLYRCAFAKTKSEFFKTIYIPNGSGLPKAEVFSRSWSFSLFGLWLWPPKFKSKYSAFGFAFNMSIFLLKIGTSKKFNPPSN